MKRTLIIALAISITSIVSASPVITYSVNENKSEGIIVAANDFVSVNETEVKNSNGNSQSDKSDKSSVNDKKIVPQKENQDGNYRDMQRGRKVLEHKYNLYA